MIKIDIEKSSEKLRKLILENPELPIVCLVDPDVCGDDCMWWYANEIYYDIGEILACETECADKIFADKDDFEETLADWMSCQEQWMFLNEADFERELQEKLKEYESYWKKVICIKATI